MNHLSSTNQSKIAAVMEEIVEDMDGMHAFGRLTVLLFVRFRGEKYLPAFQLNQGVTQFIYKNYIFADEPADTPDEIAAWNAFYEKETGERPPLRIADDVKNEQFVRALCTAAGLLDEQGAIFDGCDIAVVSALEQRYASVAESDFKTFHYFFDYDKSHSTK